MNNEIKIIDGTIYENGNKIGTILQRKVQFASGAPSSLSRGLISEKENGMKFSKLEVNQKGELVNIVSTPSKEFLRDNKRTPKATIEIFKRTSECLENMVKDGYDDIFNKYTTNFRINDDDNRDINDLIRMAYNAGFYITDGHIVIGAPSQCRTLVNLVSIIFEYRHKRKKDLIGIYRNSITYFLLLISYRYQVDFEALKKFWAYAFYQDLRPKKNGILSLDALYQKLDKKESCPYFAI